jgi:hypothetical protein
LANRRERRPWRCDEGGCDHAEPKPEDAQWNVTLHGERLTSNVERAVDAVNGVPPARARGPMALPPLAQLIV